jgi:hypothetical protein
MQVKRRVFALSSEEGNRSIFQNNVLFSEILDDGKVQALPSNFSSIYAEKLKFRIILKFANLLK